MITLSRLIRRSGIAFIVSGFLLVVVTLLHPDIFQSTLDRVVLDTPWWTEIHVLLFISTLLALLGVMGLYLAQVDETGALGLAGFLTALVGLIGMASMILFEAFLMPALATDAPATLRWDGPLFTSVTYVSAGVGGLYLLGFVALGIATFRARIFSRLGALLLTLGLPLMAVFEGPFVPFLGIASVLVLAAGQAWLGYELWSARVVPSVGEELGNHGLAARS